MAIAKRGSALVSVLWAATSLGPIAWAQAPYGASVTIRSYNGFGVLPDQMETVRLTVRAVLQAAGVEAGWRECRMSRGPAAATLDACDEKLGPSELMIRIVATPRTIRDPDVLGFSYVDVESKQALLGTVFADRASAVARRLGVEAPTLLGRVIAHEVGHLLLGSTEHPIRGLMRDRWSTRPGDSDDWLFSAGEGANLRAALAARQGQVGVSLTALERRTASPSLDGSGRSAPQP